MNECLRKCLSCVSVHPYKRRYECVHVPMHAATRACVFMRTCMNIGVYIVYMYACTHECMYECMFIGMPRCACECRA